MKVAYWDAKDTKIIDRLKSKEKIIKELAVKLGINPDNLKLTYTYPAKVFENWYDPDTLGIVEDDGKSLVVAVNTHRLNYFVTKYEGAFRSSDSDESMELIAKIYMMMVVATLTEYYTDNNPVCKEVSEGEDEGTQILANMYIASRIRMSIPKIKELTIMVNDPYIFMHYDEVTEQDWRELFDSVSYITESCAKQKKFFDAMVEKDPGKVLLRSNKVDKLISKFEKIYDAYTREVNCGQGCM